MPNVLTKVCALPMRYPVVRGMLSYAIIWPCSSLTQEYIEHGTTLAHADWARAARFSFFGAFLMAPVFYGWMKFTSPYFKGKTLKTAITRAAIEQVSYSPLALAYFLYGMSFLELKTFDQSWKEVKQKFWPTYKVGVVYWPTVQTINFHFVTEPNRIVFVSVASFTWTVYLSHVKSSKKYRKNILAVNENMIPIQIDVDKEGRKTTKVLVHTEDRVVRPAVVKDTSEDGDHTTTNVKHGPNQTVIPTEINADENEAKMSDAKLNVAENIDISIDIAVSDPTKTDE